MENEMGKKIAKRKRSKMAYKKKVKQYLQLVTMT
jgi:hypothetical protein